MKVHSQIKLVFMKSMNMYIWGRSAICKKFLYSNKVLKKNKVVSGKTPFVVIGPFYAHHSIGPNIGF